MRARLAFLMLAVLTVVFLTVVFLTVASLMLGCFAQAGLCKTAEPKTTDGKMTDGKTITPKTTAPKATAPKAAAPKTTAPKTTEKNSAYEMEQKQQQVHVIVYVTKDGVRIKDLIWNLEVITKAPTWEVVVFSRDRKIYAKERLDVWVKEGLDVSRENKRPLFPAKNRIGTVNHFGFPCGIYLEPVNFLVIDQITHEPLRMITKLRYELLDESAFDSHVSLAISSMYGLLPCKQLALSTDRFVAGSGWGKDLKTVYFREIPLKLAEISYPNLTGYRECESPSSVAISARKRDQALMNVFR
jgi:hypothetical protein